jgi:hypothetical protein
MASKKKKKATSPRKPRTAPRGMFLTVRCTDRAGLDESVRINSFNDITSLGHTIARNVRAYLRSVPMLPHVPAYSLTVWPRWTATSAAPARKDESADRDGTVDLEVDNG